jgi:GntR family transcriptional regulator
LAQPLDTVCYITNTPEPCMMTWDDRQPIYRQLADRLAGGLLEGEPSEGDAMPSVRALASRYVLNPLTVGRALQALSDDGLLENRRGMGLYVRPGARERLRELERQRFLDLEWPQLRQRLRRLGLGPDQLTWEA